MKHKTKDYDPSPYDGPIERADGIRPYNTHLYFTEDWWARYDLDNRYDSRYHFGIVSLADGRFSVVGFVYAIERNEYGGRRCVFDSRTAAIRAAGSRLIRHARVVSRLYDKGLHGSRLAKLINWVLDIVARETGAAAPRPVVIPDPPQPKRMTGFALFDFVDAVA